MFFENLAPILKLATNMQNYPIGLNIEISSRKFWHSKLVQDVRALKLTALAKNL